MYEEILAEARRTTEAAVRESRDRVDLAVRRSEAADRRAAEATRAMGDRWVGRINAMLRRASDATDDRRTELSLGADDGPAHDELAEDDELPSLSAPTASADSASPPTYGRHALPDEPAPLDELPLPKEPALPDEPAGPLWPSEIDAEDYAVDSWLEGR